MTHLQKKLEEIESRARKAHHEINALAQGKREWTMCIPVQPTDSDITLQAPLNDVEFQNAVIRRLVEAIVNISKNEGLTNLGDCCVHKTCNPVYDDGEKIAHCSFQFGVSRGFNEGASEAKEALADVERLAGGENGR